MIRDLPNWAESQFAASCAAEGMTANKSVIDRFGWDYLVEFDLPRVVGVSHDEQAGSATGRVQVKTKNGGKPATVLKLSNALRFTKETDPCYVVLYHRAKDGVSVRQYVREFDQELMAASLKRARIAARDGKTALHLIDFPVRFGPDDETAGDLAKSIRSSIEAQPANYGETKRRLAETLGYEKGMVKGTITFPASEVRAFIDHAIGLNPDFLATDVTLNRERFEIAVGAPLFSGAPDRMEVRVNPTPASLGVAGDNGWLAKFDGEFRSFHLAGGGGRASFLSRFMKAVLNEGGRLDLDYHHASDDTAPLAELAAVVAFHMAGRSPMTVWIDVKGKDRLETKALNMPIDPEPVMDWFAKVLKSLGVVCREADHPNLSLDALALNSEEATRFTDILTDGDMIVATDLPSSDVPPVRCRNLVGYAHVSLGDSVYTAILRRPCLDQVTEGGELVFKFGDPVLLETAARRGSLSDHLPRLQRRFHELSSRIGGGLIFIDDGDMMVAEGMITYQA
ncbi:hypothetical protein [Sphingomonas sp. CFBP 8764]|uniref:hypothetical protein n=1 Tax=Sphingomonas sp. CFBP 8764 TaxID=2775275 RepID=UPI0017833AEB|nr:hypothetical protein [Sphingomonas sp. CFBP 8764]MBD8552369.1 hypothetical protein [Sphingomonas sp. CFBP 8764]